MRQDAQTPPTTSTTVQPTAGPWGLPVSSSTLAAAAVLMGLMLLTYAWKALRKGPAAARAAAPAARAATPTPAPRPTPSVADEALASDLQELADRLASQLDARAERLEALLARADRTLRELRAASRAAPTEPAPATPSTPDDRGFHEIHALADQGLGALDIAKRTGRPTGQVELILNLRRGTVAL